MFIFVIYRCSTQLKKKYRMTIKEAILKVLEEQKSALTYMEVHDKIIEKDYIDWSNAKTPSDTVGAQLGHFIRQNDTRVKRVKGKRGFESLSLSTALLAIY